MKIDIRRIVGPSKPGENPLIGRPAPGAKEITKPPPYEQPRALLEMLDSGGWVGIPLIILPWLLLWLTGLWSGFSFAVAFLMLVVGIIAVWRGIIAMNAGWISGDPDTGIVTIHEGGFIWLGMSKSSAQSYTLTNQPIDTPKRRWRQRIWLLTCDDLVLGGVRYRNVRNVNDLKKIRFYRQSVITQGQDLVAPTYHAILQLLAVSTEIRDMLRGSTHDTAASNGGRTDDTQPIPLMAPEVPDDEVDFGSFRDDGKFNK